ncbi:MAG: RnfABCDGE type electron transport complex subunit B [bacterium]
MWAAISALGGIAFISAFGLGIASRFFAVEVDPRVKEVEALLPGANCGGCGFPGCSGFAEAVVAGKADVSGCVAGGATVAHEIGRVLGLQVKTGPKMIACVFCRGGINHASNRFEYSGIEDCRATQLLAGGHKACTYGCLGFGTCVKVCPFSAITMGPEGIPVIDSSKCTGCGKCVAICPRQIIRLVPQSQRFSVLCSSHDKGKRVKEVCAIGCIACQVCVKKCPVNAIHMEDSLAVIDPAECISCGTCWEKCPQKIIWTDEEGMAIMAQNRSEAGERAVVG